jgi:import inner membrane translocase subunit TIM50
VGASWYLQTTDELERTVKAREHVPEQLRDTPLEKAADAAFENLLEFRRWADEQAHNYLDPVSDKLLPDHPPEAAYVPHTLVLDLDDTLILSDWRRERGWRVFKRPGAADFLKHMAQFYEVVVFSEQLSTYVDPIVERLDPQHFLAGRLYREAAQYKNGEYLRDLSKLNRDVGKVIYVTARPKTAMQRENVVVINPYRIQSEPASTSGGGEGDANAPGRERRVDTELLDLMPFLESIVRLDVKDVREVLESYKQEQEKTGATVPEIFRARQTRFQRSRRAKSGSAPGFSREGKKWGR